MMNLATFHLGKSDITGESLSDKFLAGAGPSLAITLPAAIIGLLPRGFVFPFIWVLVRYSRRWIGQAPSPASSS